MIASISFWHFCCEGRPKQAVSKLIIQLQLTNLFLLLPQPLRLVHLLPAVRRRSQYGVVGLPIPVVRYFPFCKVEGLYRAFLA
jgi:hypothetical protein